MALLKPPLQKDLPVEYPQSLIEAKKLINQCFSQNNWNHKEQSYYLSTLGIETDLQQANREQIKLIFNDLVNSRMILI